MKDIVDKGRLDLTKVKHVILDEVDRMLDMGFIDDVEEILGHIFTSSKYHLINKIFSSIRINLERETKPQFIVFSATMPNWVHKNTKKYMTKDFMTVDLVKGNAQKTSATVEVNKTLSFHFESNLFLFVWFLAFSGVVYLSRSSWCY